MLATGFALGAIRVGMTYTYTRGFEKGRQHQADIDYRVLRYLCSTGQAFNVEPDGKFRCSRTTSL